MNTTRELINILPESIASKEDKEKLLSAISTRGKYKDYLLSNAPNTTARKIAWYAIIANVAPVRLSIGFLMFASDEDKKEYYRLNSIVKKVASGFNAVEPAFRWNLHAMHIDRKKVLPKIEKFLKEYDK